jgi:hypothetical protein
MRYNSTSSSSSSSSSSNGNTIQLPHAARAVYLFCCLLALNNAYITFSRRADPYNHAVADRRNVHEPARALQAAHHHAQQKQPNDQAKMAFIAGDNAVAAADAAAAAAAAAAVQQTVESDERIQSSMNRRHQGHQLRHQENPTSSLETTAARATAKQTKRKRSSDRVSSTNNSNTTTESKTTQLWHNHNHNQANKPESNGLATNTAAATESSSSSSSSSSTTEGGSSVKLSSPFIHYTLHPTPTFHKRQSLHNPHAFLNKFNVYYQCDSAKRKPLPRQVQTVLDYTTTLSTNLKLLVMGDSVAIQWAQALDEALGATMLDETDTAQSANATLVAAAVVSTRQVILRRRRRHEDLTVAGPLLRGGGLVAAWRITGLWTRRRENKPLPHEPGGGWTRRDLTALVSSPRYQATVNATATATPLPQPQRRMAPNTDPPPTPPLFDSLIFRIPHGWITLAQVTREDVLETIALAHELLGVRTVVFVSMPFINNVQTLQDVADLERANANLRTWVDEYNANRTLTAAGGGAGGVERVMILEFGHLMDELMALNARLMGYDTTDSQYIMDRLGNAWNNSIPFVCGERVKAVTTVDDTTQKTKVVRPTTCATNRLTYDGIHWCMESISGRVLAGLACLLGCFHNRNDTAVANNGNAGPDETKVAAMQQCEQGCNIEFMSLEQMRKEARKLPYTQH